MQPVIRHVKDPLFLLWGALTLLYSLVLCGLPLTRQLGYELALALTPWMALASSHLGARTLHLCTLSDESVLEAGSPPLQLLLRLSARAIGLALVMLAIPLLAILLNGLRIRPCAAGTGLLFFALGPGLGAIFGALNGLLWMALLGRRRWALAAAWGTISLSLVWTLWQFYDAPAIFAYDAFWGYFAGAIYDEDVAIRAPLLFARLYHLSIALTLLLAASLLFDPATLRLRLRLQASRLQLLLLLTFGLLGAALGAAAERLGFRASVSAIRHELGGSHRTAHFKIIFPVEMPAAELALLAAEHEFRYHQLVAFLGPSPRPIRSFIFDNAAQKRRLMGAARTFIAKPWRGEMYLQRSDFPQRALKHELAHVMAAPQGDPVFGISLAWRSLLGLPLPHPNIGLVEGLAVAAAWEPSGELSPHQRAAASIALGIAPPLESLFGLGFFTHGGPAAYNLAGSFCRFLLEHEGKDKLLALYRSGGDFPKVYGRPLGELARRWRTLIKRTTLPPGALELSRERLRHPAIFLRHCPHQVANLRAEATQAFGSRQFAAACRIRERIRDIQKDEPGHAFALLFTAAAAKGPRAALGQSSELLGQRQLVGPLRRRSFEFVGDLHWLAHDAAAAAKHYDEAAKHPSDAGGRRMLALKRWGIKQAPRLRDQLLGYLVRAPASRTSPAETIERLHLLIAALAAAETATPKPYWGLGHYLLAKALANNELCELALEPASAALRAGLPDRDFEREALRTLGRCALIRGQHARAESAYLALETRAGEDQGVALEARDWLARSRFMRPHTSRPAPSSAPSPSAASAQ